MDYFQLVTNSANIPRVPYLPTEPYDGGDFTNYPSRQGWDKARLSRGDFSEHPPAATAAFLQNWLHFGAFSVLLGYVKLEEFISPPDGDGLRYVVTPKDFAPGLRKYMQLLALLRFPEQEISEVERRFRAHLDEVALYVRVIHKVMEAHDARTRAHQQAHIPVYEQCPCPLPLEVAISIQLYNSILGSLYESIFPPQRGRLRSDWGSRWYARNKLITAGWCPCDIERLIAYTDAHGTYYATFLDRRETVWSHGNCSERVCIANQIDEETYLTKHVHEMCFCPLVGATVGEVEKVLRRGEVPVIEVVINEVDNGMDEEIEELDALELSERVYSDVKVIVHSSRRIPYIAISHVWSDGLGNVQGNTLPTCQLLRLTKMVQNVYARGQFSRKLKAAPICLWIDTLCVPREHSMRIKAITLMNDTYAKSLAVLVLDSELLRFRRDEFSRHEGFLAQAFVSGWSRRVWTTPEGALNVRNLWIQLESGPEKLTTTPPPQPNPTAIDLVAAAGNETDNLGITYSEWLVTLQRMYRCFGFLQYYSSIYRIPGMIFLSELFWSWHPNSGLSSPHSPFSSSYPQVHLEPPTSREQAVIYALTAALENLHGRSESKLGDRYICLASTLGLSATTIQQLIAIPTTSTAWEESRTLVLLKGIGVVPAEIIFYRGGKVTLPFAGAWRWAPRDLFDVRFEGLGMMGRRRGGVGRIDVSMEGRRGVSVRFEGWVFPEGTVGLDPRRGGFWFRSPPAGEGEGREGRWMRARCFSCPLEGLEGLLTQGDGSGSGGGGEGGGDTWKKTGYRWALIHDGGNDAALVSIVGKIPWEGWPAWVQESAGGCITARYVCAVGLEEVDDGEVGGGSGGRGGGYMSEDGADGDPDQEYVPGMEEWGVVELPPGEAILKRGGGGGRRGCSEGSWQRWWVC